MRLSQALRVFFRILRDRGFAEAVAALEQPQPGAAPTPAPATPATPATPAPAARSEALTLLAAFQREGRLVDFLQESIDAYADAQIGSAVREVHRGCRLVLQRAFSPTPVMNLAEGAPVRVEPGFDPGRIRLLGDVTGSPPYSGTLAHPGWMATRCELPAWTGAGESARVITPAEVELR